MTTARSSRRKQAATGMGLVIPFAGSEIRSADVYLTRAEVAEDLKVAPKTLANWASEGRGPKCIRFGLKGGRVRYPSSDFSEWKKTQTDN